MPYTIKRFFVYVCMSIAKKNRKKKMFSLLKTYDLIYVRYGQVMIAYAIESVEVVHD